MTTAGIPQTGASTGPLTGRGRVLFVGAGPGNPELLTVRAREILANTAEAWVDPNVTTAVRGIIAEGLPVPEEKLAAAEKEWEAELESAKAAGARRRPRRPDQVTAAEIVLAAPYTAEAASELAAAEAEASADAQAYHNGDLAGGHAPEVSGRPVPASELAHSMVERLRHGRNVVRLVAGNPVSNPAVLMELQEVTALGVEFEVVPGMTGASALPAYTGIATGEGYTAVDLTADKTEVDWDGIAAAPKPLILTASPSDLPAITGELKRRNVPGSTPVTATTHATTRRQRSYDVTLDTLKSVVAASGPVAKEGDMPEELVVTIGTAASSRSKYSWWENRALYGWTVLVPRAKSQAGPMSARLASHGAIPIEVPTISVEPPRSPAQMERAVKGLVDGRYHWIVFTSVNAVKATWEKLAEFGLDARALAGVRVAAVGQKTAQAVRDLGIAPELLPASNARNASGLVDVFPPFDPDLDPVDRVLLPRADIATDTLVDGLIDLGWSVEDVVAYR
ncbi:MAG: uroporphyrinogen-III synthase, partial [Mycobacteriaceae bacterium]